MKTYRGVYYNLKESEFTYTYENLTFYFSSVFNLTRFIKRYPALISDELLKLKAKYDCIIYADYIVILHLYKKLEKRGFYVLYKDKELDKNYCFKCELNL